MENTKNKTNIFFSDLKTFEEQRLEIFGALLKLGPENLSVEEKRLLTANANSSMKDLISINDDEQIVKDAKQVFDKLNQ